MNWIDVKTALPKNTNNVLVSDGYGHCALAWIHKGNWQPSYELINTENHDGGCSIKLDVNEINFWAEIDTESCPFPDWKD